MAMSIQTNVNSLISQENLRVNNDFQAKTIARLTSGYRINQSGDDAAGLAVANKFRSDTAELTQGVRNANDGISQLQIVDGGLSNISQMLDRMKTLATESASGTFSGNRDTLNNEYQALIKEVDRQASNINLNKGGKYNANINVYIGGGSSSSNAQVNIDLSGAANQVDSAGLKVDVTSVSGGGVSLGTVPASGAPVTAQQSFSFYIDGATSAVTVTHATTSGSVSDIVDSLNKDANAVKYGITFSVAKNATSGQPDKLLVSSAHSFSVSSAVTAGGIVAAGVSSAAGQVNLAKYNVEQSADWVDNAVATTTESLTFTSAAGTATISSLGMGNIDTTLNTINNDSTFSTLGIKAVKIATSGGFRVGFQSDSFFTVSATDTGAGMTAGAGFAAASAGKMGTLTAADTAQSATGNAQSAITALTTAVQNLGKVQGIIGTSQNKLSYAINLAQSQITNFSAAESRIRDTDVAAEAANLTKAQVLSQASMAAMAQANSAPQQVLSLLRG